MLLLPVPHADPGPPRPGVVHLPAPATHTRMATACPLPGLTNLVALEVGVLDDAEQVAERVAHGRHLDAAADVFHRLMNLGPQPREAGQLRCGVRNAPVR